MGFDGLIHHLLRTQYAKCWFGYVPFCMYLALTPFVLACIREAAHASKSVIPLSRHSLSGTTITPSTTTFAAETRSVCFVPSCFSFLWVPRHPSHVLHSSLTGKGGCVRFLFNPSPQPRLICHRLNFLEHGFGQHIAAVATFLATKLQALSITINQTQIHPIPSPPHLFFASPQRLPIGLALPHHLFLNGQDIATPSSLFPVARHRVASLCLKCLLQSCCSSIHRIVTLTRTFNPKDPRTQSTWTTSGRYTVHIDSSVLWTWRPTLLAIASHPLDQAVTEPSATYLTLPHSLCRRAAQAQGLEQKSHPVHCDYHYRKYPRAKALSAAWDCRP